MRFLLRCVHALVVGATVLLTGALIFFAIGSAGLRSSSYETVVTWSTPAVLGGLAAFALWGLWKKLPYRWLLPALSVGGGLVIYLVYDHAARPPSPEPGRVTPADSKSYATYRWLLKGDPQSRLSEQPKGLGELPAFPAEREEWPDFFAKHRTLFAQGWEKDRLGRAWVEAMAESVPEGIYPLQKRSAPRLDFSILRRSARLRWGYAQVLVLDGRPDDAAQLLLPFLRANYHLHCGGSSLITQMIALVGVRGTYDQLEMLADAGRLSATTRADVVAALAEAPPPTLIIHNAFLGEQFEFLDELTQGETKPIEAIEAVVSVDASQIPTHKLLWRLFYNPRRSGWDFSEFLRETGRLAEARQLEPAEAEGKEFVGRINRRRVKNPVGQIMMEVTLPAYGKLTKGVWETEDRRKTLLQRLANP